MDERTQRVSDLLHEAGEVHYVVYRITDGEDDDQASSYAAYGESALERLTPHQLLDDAPSCSSVRSAARRPRLARRLARTTRPSATTSRPRRRRCEGA